MVRLHILIIAVLTISSAIIFMPYLVSARLKTNYYAKTCPTVETIVRNVVNQKIQQSRITIAAVLRLFFHDCFVEGCDASVIIASTQGNTAERDHPDNLSLAGDGFDTVIKAKVAIDAIPSCKNKVSCADILAIATRDVIQLAGGPGYQVELGRLDGLTSKASNVEGNLPEPTFNLDRLNTMFASHGLNQADMIALSAHTLGAAHCAKFSKRLYNFSPKNPVDPTLSKTYAAQLQQTCPKNVDPGTITLLDPTTPNTFDNVYFKNLQKGMGLFTSDQVLFTDKRSKGTVNLWASNSKAFQTAFVNAMIKLGRVGVKTGKNGNIRRDCGAFN
ncbi:peroxidase 51-like isoform X2 [Lycium barbarum]|uniref:peroxidase 51-like isoform X2 n=1 Tax=Lycium barbarum TaxID=112863 RepID=UPI00293E03F9|nr:peroxidase 51-like isoform X2 [Lycium barbarum]